MRIIRNAVVSGILTAVVAVTLPAAPAEAKATADYRQSAFNTTNNKREAHDKRKFREGNCLQNFANRQARRMANQTRIFHQDLYKVLNACDLKLAAENVASGFSNGHDVVVDGWMKSPGHRANILNGKLRRMAVAARKGDNGVWYAAQVFGTHA
jgi:uncharacterized protein YkwD